MQTLESRKKAHEKEAIAHLEASRLTLIEKINQYPVQGNKGNKKLQVLEELKSCFGNKETEFNWKFEDHKKKKKLEKKKNQWIISSLFNVTKTAIKLVIFSAIISSSIGFYKSRKMYFRKSKREIISPMDSKMGRNLGLVENDASIRPIDVFHGRG